MEVNESRSDRIVRGLLSVGLLLFATRPFGAGRMRLWQAGAAALGTVLGITAITGRCGIYRAFGLSTRNNG